MKVDSTITDVIVNVSAKTGAESSKVLDILNKYYLGITHVIENEPPGVIKIDFFGKLIYNQLYKKRLDDIRKNETI